MNTAATAPTDLTSPPEPNQIRPNSICTLPQLLDLVRRLIAHGKEFAATLHRRSADPGFARAALAFGSSDPGVILICICRGIMRATALHAMLLRREARGLDVPFPPRSEQLPPVPGASGAPSAGRAKWWLNDDLSYLPTQQEVDDEVRRRAPGRLLMAISLDLGLTWESADTLWHDLQLPIVTFGGRGHVLLWETLTRMGEIPIRLQQQDALRKQRRAERARDRNAGLRAPDHQAPAAPRPDRQSPGQSPPECASRPAARRSSSSMQPETEPSMQWPVNPPVVQEVAATAPS
jgi:hypothetical protein